jgi:D-alanyl-D-alanine carboxypeptidase
MPLVLAALLVATACEASEIGASDREALNPSRSWRTVLEGMLREHAEQHDAGVIALVERDGVVWRGAAGRAQGERLAEAGDCFDIGSIGKTMVATVALQLVDEGRLSLDDSVERWLPADIEGGRRVLVRHLLNHTSGLAFTPSLGDVTVASTPGSSYAYSNLGYDVLGEILAEVTARPMPEEIRSRILAPLDLAEASSAKPGTSKERASPAWLGSAPPAAHPCGPISTTSDLARFFQGLLRGELLDEDMLAEMMTTVPTGTEFHAGLGIFRADLPCGSAWGHGGDTGLQTSQVLASRDGSTIVVVARNVGDWASLKTLAEQMYCQVI